MGIAKKGLCWLAAAAGPTTLALLLAPASGDAFESSGESLGLDQRDVRVFNNFTDAAANDNTTPHPSFPGAVGAELAIWKSAIEWGSELHGDGLGDTSQLDGLGSGGANFDPSWQGTADGVGGLNDNVHSELSGSDIAILAYCETPASDGWRIRYFSNWDWKDGPGTNVFEPADLQGVATHEYGHALGLGHSAVLGATMYPTAAGSGLALRSIEADDVAGIRSIYGVKAADKPRILAVELSHGALTIEGWNFSPAGNEVWFTRAGNGPHDGTPVKVKGLNSVLGGTRLDLSVPPNAGPGDILVKRFGTGHSKLSNAWPLDPSVDGKSGGPPVIASIEPAAVPPVTVGPNVVVLHGTGFASAGEVQLDGQLLAPGEYVIVDDTRLTFELPLMPHLGEFAVIVSNPAGVSAPAGFTLVASEPPQLVLVNPTLFSAEGMDLILSGVPGDTGFLTVSALLEPTTVPGLLELDIGGQLESLFLLASPTLVESGWVRMVLPIGGLPFGTPLHFQAAVFDASERSFPLVSSNVQSGVFYF